MKLTHMYTVELGYLEFCKTKHLSESKIYFDCFLQPLFGVGYKSKLPEVQINLHFG